MGVNSVICSNKINNRAHELRASDSYCCDNVNIKGKPVDITVAEIVWRKDIYKALLAKTVAFISCRHRLTKVLAGAAREGRKVREGETK